MLVRYEMLGPLTIRDDDGMELRISRRKTRTVLAVMLCAPGTVVPTARLVDELWPGDPPPTALNQVRVFVHELRRMLGTDRISRVGDGYTLTMATGDESDAARFVELRSEADTAERAGDAARAARLLRSALDVWRGEMFGAADPSSFLGGHARRWEEERLRVHGRCLDLELDGGGHHALVPELTELVARYPLAEGFRARLMLALYRCGRSSDALTVFTEGRRLLVDETGLEPGPALREVHQAILRSDPELSAPTAEHTQVPEPPQPPPRQLPADIGDFTGRDKQVDELYDLLAGDAEGRPVVVSAIAGRGGIGKTTLAVHTAHRLATEFPDGQLYVNLRGMEPAALEPGVALARFLHSLGLRGAGIPDTLEQRAALYRSMLAGRQLLVVLDNARDEQQVRPLLPGASGGAVLITSRAPLAALEGASGIELGALAPERALELLARIAGAERVAREPEAAEAIVGLCGHLPLAVRIAGARLAAHPRWPLTRLADRLADERHRLDELAIGDLHVRSSLALSYGGLSALAQRALRLLAFSGLADFAPWVLAPLLDVDFHTSESLIEVLVQAQLLDVVGEDAAGQPRYRPHDLVRVFGRERCRSEDSEQERRAALRRLVAGWTAVADACARRMPSGAPRFRRGQSPHLPVPDGVLAELLAEPAAWFETEMPNLAAAVGIAESLDLAEPAWELFAAMVTCGMRAGSRPEILHSYESAALVCRRAGNRRGEAIVESGIGFLSFQRGDFTAAVRHLRRSRTISRSNDRKHDEAIAQCGLAITFTAQGRLTEAVASVRGVLPIFESYDDTHATSFAAEILGAAQAGLGRYADARQSLDTALRGYRYSGDRRGEANTCARMSRAFSGMDDRGTAVEWFDRARALFLEMDTGRVDVEANHELGMALLDLDRRRAARDAVYECLHAYRRSGMDERAAHMLAVLGDLALRDGELDAAAGHLDGAHAIWAEHDMPLWRARALLTRGDLYAARDEHRSARQAWREARSLFAELDNPEVDQATRRLDSSRGR